MKPFVGLDGNKYPVSDACDLDDRNVRANLYATVRRLLERPDRHVDTLYGEPVPIDMLKFTDWSPDSCGCQLRFVWRRDQAEDVRTHHAHLAIRKCADHARHATHEDHFTAVLAHNRAKNGMQ